MLSIPVILILGPTASGKSALAVALAQRFQGEVVCADAMTVYRGLDLGTAKPSANDRSLVPHHCLDLCEPEETCHLQRWFDAAEAAIAGIHARGRLSLVTGGSPLYTKSIIEGLSAGCARDEALRQSLEERYDRLGGEALLAELAQVDPTYAADRHPHDKRRIVRALEVFQATGIPYSQHHVTDGQRRSDYRCLLLGLAWDKEVLHRRINARTKAMFAAGLVEEVRILRHRLSPEARQAVGYKEVIAHLDGLYDLDFALYQVQKASRHLAKHQLTWYRRFRDIRWLSGDAADLVDQAARLVAGFLAGGADPG